MIHHGDCLDVMAAMEPESVDAVVTDPPYDLTSTGARKGSPRNPGTGPFSRGFMGKAWDGTGIAFDPETWAAALRVAKPSAYLLAFGGTRTVHRMAVALEDAGWIIRDMLVWAYASGFPKSKASLKPAWEPIVMARKPGPLRDLAIDACRIGSGAMGWTEPRGGIWRTDSEAHGELVEKGGRWPANVILTDPIFDGGVEGVVGGGETTSGLIRTTHKATVPSIGGVIETGPRVFGGGQAEGWREQDSYGDSGTYSRFFLIPKADRAEREPVPGMLVERGMHLSGGRVVNTSKGDGTGIRENRPRANVHPTVKPVDLMRHLVRLVTPPGGIVLDPFLGSGTTGIACEMEGFPWVGIEKEAEYVAIAEARLVGVQTGMGLVG